MPAESIVFAPELDERQLDRETDNVNEQLQDVGRDLPLTFDGEMPDVGGGGITPAGGGGGGGAPPGTAGAAAGLASKVPKPVAGVTAAAALPVALSGAVGVGMLSEMAKSSARLQTSASILSQANDAIWRPLGDRLDQLFIRDIVKGIRDEALNFEELVRGGGSGLLPGSRREAGRRIQAAGQLAGFFPTPAAMVAEMGLKSVGRLIAGDFEWPSLPDFEWPSPRNILDKFVWPSANALLNKFVWPSATRLAGDFEWPSAQQLLGAFDTPGPGDIVDEVFGDIDLGVGDVLDAITGGGGGGGDGGTDINIPGTGLGGGNNQRTGSTSPSVGQTSGGGGNNLGDKLDRLIRELRDAGDVVLQANGRELSRAQRRASETDPRAR